MKNPSAYLKMQVLGAVDGSPGRTSHERVLHAAGLAFPDEEGNFRQFTWRTIQTWMYRYRKHGVTGMAAGPRKDKGTQRKITPEELLEALNDALVHFHGTRFHRSDLYKHCIEKGTLTRERIAPTTFYRFIREYHLLDEREAESRMRLAFSMRYANDLWQADTMYGPHVQAGTEKKQAYLIAFIDDASRVLCHGEFFLHEDNDSFVRAIRSAFYKRGIPQQLYVDNGSIYRSAEITLICARVGCILRHTAVRDAAAKGKIERFFRRVREQFLSRVLDLSSLEALNRQFIDWVENDYNATVHAAIGLKPIDRFGLDLGRIRFLPPSETTDELFYAEETRTVKKDNTFSFKSIRYEVPVDLREREIVVRFDRASHDRLIVYYKDQRMGEAKPVDLVGNGELRRRRLEGQA